MQKDPPKILLAGATGYIGKAVASELARRGYTVTAVNRTAAEVPGCRSVEMPDIANREELLAGFANDRFDAVVSCIASRSGVADDAWHGENEMNRALLAVAEQTGARRFVLLSAICVQRPRLAFQHAKLAFEAELRASTLEHAIVRPTAFFKSLSGQVSRVLAGKPFLIFGSGNETACKPISASDLAGFIADSIDSDSARNAILPIGGPGAAITPREQGEILFELSGRAPRFRSVSPRIFTAVSGLLTPLGRLWPTAARKAELARIGHYYATESMLLWDEQVQRYDAQKTPSYGAMTLREHYARMLRGENEDHDLGDHAIF